MIFDMIRHGIEDKEEYLSGKGAKIVESFTSHINKNYTYFLTSPYPRCQQTLRIILKATGNHSFMVIPWLCTRFPRDWNSLIYSLKFKKALVRFGNKLETVRQLDSSLLFKDAKHTLVSIQKFAKEQNYCGKVLAISHNVLISATAGLFRVNSIFDQEFDNLLELSGARILIRKNYQTSKRLTLL